MLVLTLLASFLVYTSFGRVSSLSLTEDVTANCLKSIQCPMAEAPLCVRVRNITQPSSKPMYILALNDCEMKYLKCHPGLDAEVVAKKACHFGNESQTSQNVGAKKRIKRGTRNNKEDELGIIEFTSNHLKNEDLKKLTEWSASSLEEVEGRIHFGFVVEISRYVEHVLPYIRNSINAILNMVSNDKSKRIKDMVLSVYVYPQYNGTLMTRTDNAKEFMISVDSLNCMCHNQANVRCEQDIYQATVLSLDRAMRGTHMFVFANSPPSDDDTHFDIEVTRLAQEKEVEVTFVVTGDCGTPTGAAFQSYYPVAAGTRGQVLRIDRKHLKSEFLHYILHTVMEHDRRIVVSTVYPAKGSNKLRIPFTVREKDDFVAVTVSGDDCNCVVYNYKNNTMDYAFNVTTQHVKMYKYITLDPGEYRVHVLPNDDVKARRDLSSQVLVTVAMSSIQMLFKYGFSENPTDTLKNTDAQPAEDTSLYIIVAVREPKGLVAIKNVVLLSMDDEIVSTYRLIETSQEDVYRTKYQLTIPKHTRMKIKISGNLRYNVALKKIERTSTRIIKPYKFTTSTTTTSTTTTATTTKRAETLTSVTSVEGEDVKLECGLPAIKRVKWSFKKLGSRRRYRPLAETRPILILRSVTVNDAGFYKCKPASLHKEGKQVIQLQIEERGDWQHYQDSCPTKCPVRDVMVCARCQHGVHRTFMSGCYMRMYQCSESKERLELVAHQSCVASAPYLGEMPGPQTSLSFPNDGDIVLQFLDDRRKSDG